MVAAQGPVLLVEDAPGAAVRAAAQPAALAALQHRRVAAPVQEDEALLAARDALAQCRQHLRSETRDGARAQALGRARQPAHVDQADRRPGRAADALGQGDAAIAAGFGALPGLERRRRRSEQHRDALAPAAPDREVARRVARTFLLLVRRVVLLVDDDQAEPRQRGEHRQAGAEHQVGQTELRRQPAAQPLRRRQPAVQGDDAPAGEAAREALDQLRREVDLGHQHQRLPAGAEHLLGRAQIDLGLAAAGDAVQQRRAGIGPSDRPADRRRGRGLGVGEGGPGLVGRRRVDAARPRLAQPAHAIGERVAAEPTQLGRQHRQGDLAGAALVVPGGEFDQRAPIGGERRDVAAYLGDRLQLGRGEAPRPAPSTTPVRRPRADRRARAPGIRGREGAHLRSSVPD